MEKPFVRVTRGGITESEHHGIVAVVSDKGELIASHGDVEFVTFARSSAKPVQAIPLVESGAIEHYHLEEGDLALFCASHSSELQHTDRVEKVLNTIGLDETHLQCGPHFPHWKETYDRLLLANQPLTSLYSNCSGKHTGMLTYAKHTGTDVSTYHKIEHPLQQSILAVLSELSEVAKNDIIIGVDGCGVPTFGLPVLNWATVFGKFAAPEDFPHGAAMARISQAMRTYPELVGGTNRFDTDLMKVTEGRILCKGGAEGFIGVSVPEKKVGIAIKVRDGNARAIAPALMKTLVQLDAITDAERQELKRYELTPNINTRDELVGEVLADFDLTFH